MINKKSIPSQTKLGSQVPCSIFKKEGRNFAREK